VARFGIGQNNADFAAAKILLRDRWHYVAGTYDGEHIRIFVDGVAGSQTALHDATIVRAPTPSAPTSRGLPVVGWSSRQCCLTRAAKRRETPCFGTLGCCRDVTAIPNHATPVYTRSSGLTWAEGGAGRGRVPVDRRGGVGSVPGHAGRRAGVGPRSRRSSDSQGHGDAA
jgi:hypothetical protein